MTLDLEAIKASADKATPGPWTLSRDFNDVDNTEIYAPPAWFEDYGMRLYGVRPIVTLSERNPNEADAEFIAHARADIPALVAEVERLTTLAEWLISLDDVDGPGAQARRTVTLTQIIGRAREAVASRGEGTDA